jgi:hypothetical protein
MSSYVTVAASQTDSVLGPGIQGHNAGKGSLLKRLIVTVDTATDAVCTLEDGTTGAAIPITTASAPVGVHIVELGISSTIGPWQITTGANATVIAVGDFG